MPKIKEKLTELGKSIQWLADSVGTDRPLMSNISHGKCLPTTIMMPKITDSLKCGIGDLFTPLELDFTSGKSLECIRSKYERIRGDKLQINTNILNFCVRIEKSGYPLLNKKILHKCGFPHYADFLNWAANEQLQRRYDWIIKKEQARIEQARSQSE